MLRIGLLAALLPALLTAQHTLLQVTDATSVGLAGAGVAGEGYSALWLNPAGLAGSGDLSFGASVLQKHRISKLNVVTGGLVYRGFGLQLASLRFGDFSSSRVGVAYGRRLSERWRIGGELLGLRTSVQNFAPILRLVAGVGLQYSATEQLDFGVRMVNPFATGGLSTGIIGGAKYALGERVSLSVDECYDSLWGLSTRLGIAYAPAEVLQLQFGFETHPGQISFGASYQLSDKFRVGAVGVQHPALGVSGGAGFNHGPAR